jgi:hypothetical protein
MNHIEATRRVALIIKWLVWGMVLLGEQRSPSKVVADFTVFRGAPKPLLFRAYHCIPKSLLRIQAKVGWYGLLAPTFDTPTPFVILSEATYR